MREATRAKIAAIITDGWAGPCTLIWDNQAAPLKASVLWARIGVTFGKAFPAAVGGEYDRLPGVVWLQIFTPANKGTKAVNEATDRLDALVAKTRHAITGTGFTGEIQFDQNVSGPESSAPKDEYQQFNANISFLVHRFTA